ncbi:MAG: hypothetical protein MK060_01700 [Blastomonas sp.]|uniref:hypothetical protein n=1 Tax=Blastomonas sp. TaxID=1909299 RepID=UPI00406A5CA2|nr:hypothetical protein [Blastomonas sp.]
MRPKTVAKPETLCAMVLATLAACDGTSGAYAHNMPQQAANPTENQMAAITPSPLTRTDHNALEMAKHACESRDFRALFTAIAVSPAVRRKYSAASITIGVLDSRGKILWTRQVAATAYNDFPVTQIDFYYKPTKHLKAGDEDEYLDIQFNQSQSGDFSVDWARVHYDGQSDGGDDLGNIVGPDGKPLPPGMHPFADGQLLFRPVGDCWKLREDIRWWRQ